MNKKVKYLISGLIFLAAVSLVWWNLNSLQTLASKVGINIKENAKEEALCFANFGEINKQGFYDKYTLKMFVDKGNAKGELKFIPAEKDSKLGSFVGNVSNVDKNAVARKVDAVWDTFAEGMNTKEEVKILFGEGVAYVGFGEMVDDGHGVYVYKDPENIKYSLQLSDIPCGDVDERELVENYLRLNIVGLSPVKSNRGGVWQVLSVFVDMVNNEGGVVYQDGRVQEKRIFTYSTNEKGEILSLIIK